MKTLFFITLFALLPYFATSAEASTLIQGSSNAAVQVTIYGDIQCPFTARLMTYLPKLEADFGDRVAVNFSHFPLSFHAEAKPAAIAANCAGDKFPAFLKDEFAQQALLGSGWYVAEAKKLGLDETTFKACLVDQATAASVDSDVKAGTARGVNSTPTYYIGDEVVRGVYPYSELKEKIEKLMRK
jgi:protein-disulfide isomerase